MSDKLAVLKMEYEHAKKELFYYMNRYDKNDTFNSIIVSLFSLVLTTFKLDLVKTGDIQLTGLIGVFIIFFFSIISNYIFVMTIGSLYYIILNSARLRKLEEKINTVLGEELLNWESDTILKIHALNNFFLSDTKMINIDYIKGVFFILLHLATQAFLVYLMFNISIAWYIAFIVYTCFIYLFVFSQWYFYLKYLSNHFYVIMSKKELYSKGSKIDMQKEENNSVKVYSACLTLIIGIVPMFLSSFHGNAFWFDSGYDLPLIYYMSIIIGDAVILPYFNALLFDTLMSSENKKKLGCTYSYISIFISMLLSTVINYYSHFLLWSQDNITSFMDYSKGELSLGGWSHFGFSTIQMAIIFYFLFMYHRIIKFPKSADLKKMKLLLMTFTLLQIPDFIIRNWSEIFSRGFFEPLTKDFSSFLTIPIIFIFFYLSDRCVTNN